MKRGVYAVVGGCALLLVAAAIYMSGDHLHSPGFFVAVIAAAACFTGALLGVWDDRT